MKRRQKQTVQVQAMKIQDEQPEIMEERKESQRSQGQHFAMQRGFYNFLEHENQPISFRIQNQSQENEGQQFQEGPDEEVTVNEKRSKQPTPLRTFQFEQDSDEEKEKVPVVEEFNAYQDFDGNQDIVFQNHIRPKKMRGMSQNKAPSFKKKRRFPQNERGFVIEELGGREVLSSIDSKNNVQQQ
ncbi:hypothetical protein FGO68_gene17302 [Halteria grandinella]|uniref:Uncharacterized protein n=1 Tax=Halteria grandinella TaxID=5974 RepID=A0A8J8NFD2_HALGN|nr:hypothetical protein FGO68_gene17302 [Halteria grandinella]